MTSTYTHFLFSSSWSVYVLLPVWSTVDSPAFVFRYPGTCRVRRLSALIAFEMSALHLCSLCMWLAMASIVLLYFAVYFAFPMSKVWLSSPNTFVMNFFLMRCSCSPHGSAYFFCPLNLGCGLRHILSFFLICTTGDVPSKEACTADDGRGSTRLLINNVDATF